MAIQTSAIATLVAQLAMNGILLFETRKFMDISPLRNLSKIIVSSAVMGVVVYVLLYAGMNSLIIMAVGAITYTAMLRMTKEPTMMKVIGILKGS